MERLALPLAMFIGSFSWSFVYVSLPFHVQHISTWDPASTLRWTGWILGVTSLVTVVAAPRVGFRASCVVGAFVLFAAAGVVKWGVREPPDRPEAAASAGTLSLREATGVIVLALAPAWALYLVLAAVGLAAVPVAMWRRLAS